MEDKQIVELYLLRDERAVAETERKYGQYCTEIADRILKNPHDAEEAVNDTWLQTWNSIPPQKPAVLKLYLAKITRNLAFSRYRSQTAEKRGGGEIASALDELSECVGTGEDLAAGLEFEELTDAIRRFLQSVSNRDRQIFIRRYFFLDTTVDIARRWGLKESNVHMILARIRKKLKTHLIKEGYWV